MTAPDVILGAVADRSIAPAIRVLVERGAGLRPELARDPASVRLRFAEGWPAVLVVLGPHVLVSDDDETEAEVEVRASLPDLVALLTSPLARGIPNPMRAEGRAAIGRVIGGDVDIDGRRATALRLLRLMSFDA